MSHEIEIQSPYQMFCANDVIEILKARLEAGTYRITPDGKIEPLTSHPFETPWIHIRSSTDYDCETAKRVFYSTVMKELNVNFVPSGCQECWKVVVRPRTLQELFKLLAVQQRMDVDSKCGIEPRRSVPALYGGYFYTRSIHEGLERYKQVRAEVDEHISPDVKVILKRGCTEFEHRCGDSSKWAVSEWQKAMEALMDEVIIKREEANPQPTIIQNHVKRRWIEWAYQNGDPTYKLYTDGQPLYPEYFTYHHLVDRSPEEIEAFLQERATLEVINVL